MNDRRAHRRRACPVALDFPRDEEWLELQADVRYLLSTHGRLYSTIRRRVLIPQWLRRPGDEPMLYWRIGRNPRRVIRCAHWVLTTFGPPQPSAWEAANTN